MKMSDLYSKFKVYNVMGNEIDFTLEGNLFEFSVSREPRLRCFI